MLTSSLIDFLLILTGFMALKYPCRGNSDMGSMRPDSWLTEKSSPRFSSPFSLQATGSWVRLRRYRVLVSFLEEKTKNVMVMKLIEYCG